MKIAISSNGKNTEDNVSEVFGRCSHFVIVEIKNKKAVNTETVENIHSEQQGRTGISVAQSLVDKKIEAVITGNIGPRALDVLRQLKIEVFIGSGPVNENIRQFLDGKLKKIN